MDLKQRSLGPYSLLAELGSGGMGTVYLALQRGVGGFEKKVALKCINREAAGDKQFVAMLVDEARLMAQLTHPNIVQVIDLAEDDGLHYVVMEYVEGIDLRSLAEDFDLSLDESVHIIAEAARGLAYAHRKCGPDGAPLGIVHRDISGHNLLVSDEGITKVLDFGIAKAASNRHRTEIGTLKGKLAYMSPEQAMGKNLDSRSDLFSLGIVLWELCTKRRLFIGDTEIQLLMKVQRCEVEPPSRLVEGFPRQLEDIILKCLAANVDERYSDGERLADDLFEFQRTYLGATAPRTKIAGKVSAYLRTHPRSEFAPAAPADSEKTMAAPAAGQTMAFTRIQTPKQPKAGQRRRRWGMAAIAFLLVAVVGTALRFGPRLLKSMKQETSVTTQAAMQIDDQPSVPAPEREQPKAMKQAARPQPKAEPSKAVQSKAVPQEPVPQTSKPQTPMQQPPTPQSSTQQSPVPQKAPVPVAPIQAALPRSTLPPASPPPARSGSSSEGLKPQEKPVSQKAPAKVATKPPTPVARPKPVPKVAPAPAPAVAPVAAPAAPETDQPARLSLNAAPWARVYIDGVAVSQSTPLLNHELPAGKHKIILVNPELRVRREIILDLKAGEHHRETIPLQ